MSKKQSVKPNPDITKKSAVIKKPPVKPVKCKVIITETPKYVELPLDAWRVIGSFASVDTLMRLTQVSTYMHRIIEGFWKMKIAPFTLTAQQYMFCLKIQEVFEKPKIKEVVTVQPMGWGKTLMAIYYIEKFCKDVNTLILVPPHVLKVWMKELITLKFILPDPKKSKVLVCHNSRPKHFHYYHNEATGNIPFFEHHRIIIATRLRPLFKDRVNFVVIDEFHKNYHYFLHDYGESVRFLGLTAEDVKPNLTRKVLRLKDDEYEDRLPDIDYHYYVVDNGVEKFNKKQVHIFDMMENEDAYNKQLLLSLKGKKKAVISVDRGCIGDYVRKFIDEDGRYKVFELLSSMATVDKFLSCEDEAVLFIGSNNNEGLNILAEHLIMIKPDTMNCSRIRQTINRIRRPNNPHKKLTCNFVVGGELALIKTFYSTCYANSPWGLSYDDSPDASFLFKCCSIMKLLGCNNVLELPLPDGCIIFDSERGVSRCDDVLKWWEQNKTSDTILTTKTIMGLY